MAAVDKPDNLVEFLENSLARRPDRPLFGTKNAQGVYEWLTYRQFGRRVDELRAGLAGLGVGRGDAVGIIANNRTEWAIAAYATYGLGGRFVPMYESELPRIWEYIVADSAVKVLFVSKPEILQKVSDFLAEKTNLAHLICEAGGKQRRAGGEGPSSSGEGHPTGARRDRRLIYTSGTTEPRPSVTETARATMAGSACIPSHGGRREPSIFRGPTPTDRWRSSTP